MRRLDPTARRRESYSQHFTPAASATNPDLVDRKTTSRLVEIDPTSSGPALPTGNLFGEEERLPSYVEHAGPISLVPEFSALVSGLTQQGFDDSVAERIVLIKGPGYAQRLLTASAPEAPVTVYRGINTSIEAYNPKATLSGGNLWVTRDQNDAQGFTEMLVREGRGGYGLLLHLQLPMSMFGTPQTRQLLSRHSDIPDDRAFLCAVGVREGETLTWHTYEDAIAKGYLRPLTADDLSVTVTLD